MLPKKNRPMLANGDRVLKDAFKDVGKYIELPARRAFLQRSMTLGGLALLTGCSITDDESVEIVGVEAAGEGLEGRHAASLAGGSPGVLHGNKTYLLQDEDGQITEAHSISAGLDYPGIGPEHAWLHEIGRVRYVPVTDDEALASFQRLCKLEGIIPALESAHAIAAAERIAPTLGKGKVIVVNLSGRGDKDIFTVAEALGVKL